jgi:hypothetical protein
VSIEQRILFLAESPDCNHPRELRAIALEGRKREDRIKQLEDRIHRAASAFFRDGSDGQVASQMLQILEEERGNVSKEPLQSDSSIWSKAGIGFTTEDKP